MEGGGGEVAGELQEVLGAAGLAVAEDRGRARPGLVAVETHAPDAVAEGEAVLELRDADLQGGGAGQRAGGGDVEGRGVGTEEPVDAVGAGAERRGDVEGRRGRREAPLAVADQRLVERRGEVAVVHLQRQRADAGRAEPVGGRGGVGAELDGRDGGGKRAVKLDGRTLGGQDVGRRVEADGRAAVDDDVAGARVGGGQRHEGRAFETDVIGAARTEEDRAVGGDQASVPRAVVGADGEVGTAALLERVRPGDQPGQDEVVVRLDTGEVREGRDAVEPRDERVVVVGQEPLKAQAQASEGQQLVGAAALAAHGIEDGVAATGDDVIAEGDTLQVAGAVAVDADREGAAAQEDVGRARERRREAERPAPALVAGDDGEAALVDEGTVEGVRTGRLPVVEGQGAAADLDQRRTRAADDLAGVGPVGAQASDGQRRAFHQQGAADVLDGALDERTAQVAEFLAQAVEVDRGAGVDDDGGSDDRVQVARRREGVGDIERQDALADADVALQAGRRGQGQRARAELRQDVGERVVRVVAGVGEGDADRRRRRRVDVQAERVGPQVQRGAGAAGQAGAAVQDDAREAEGAARSRAHPEGIAAEADALVRDERVDGTIAGEERGRAARVEDLRGARGEVEVAGGAIGRGHDAAGGVTREIRGGRSAGALDHGPRTDQTVDQRRGGGEDDLLVRRAAEVGVDALERQRRVGGARQRTEG